MKLRHWHFRNKKALVPSGLVKRQTTPSSTLSTTTSTSSTALTCPLVNGTTYTTSSNQPYELYCYTDFSGADLPAVNAGSYAQCIEQCDAYIPAINQSSDAICVASVYNAYNPNLGNCYLKYQVELDKVYANNTLLQAARRVQYPFDGQPVYVPYPTPTVMPQPFSILISKPISIPTTIPISKLISIPTTILISKLISMPTTMLTSIATTISASMPTSIPSSIPTSMATLLPPQLPTPAPNPAIFSKNRQSSSLSIGAKVGIAISILTASVLLLALIIVLWRRKRKRRHLGQKQEAITTSSNRSPPIASSKMMYGALGGIDVAETIPINFARDEVTHSNRSSIHELPGYNSPNLRVKKDAPNASQKDNPIMAREKAEVPKTTENMGPGASQGQAVATMPRRVGSEQLLKASRKRSPNLSPGTLSIIPRRGKRRATATIVPKDNDILRLSHQELRDPAWNSEHEARARTERDRERAKSISSIQDPMFHGYLH